MKFRLAVAGVLLCAHFAYSADLTLYQKPADKAYSRQTARQLIPQALPTTPTVMVSGDFYCDGLTIKNTTASPITVTIQSVTGSVVLLDSSTTIAAGQLYVVNIPFGYWFVGGMIASASSSGVNGYFSGRN